MSSARAQRRTTLILFVVFVGLLLTTAIANVARRGVGSTPQPGVTVTLRPTIEPNPFLFPKVEPTQIIRIELEARQTGRKLILMKVPGDWQGTDEAGKSVAVDLTKIPQMLRILATLRYNRVIESNDLEMFGLSDGGKFIVRFVTDTTYTLHIGDTNPDQSLVYVRRGEAGPVLLVSAERAMALVRLVDSQAAVNTAP